MCCSLWAGANINPLTGKRQYIRRGGSAARESTEGGAGTDASAAAAALKRARGRPSKARMELDAQLAAEHEVAELTLVASLGDGMCGTVNVNVLLQCMCVDDDEFAGLRDDGDMGSDEFSDGDDEPTAAATSGDAHTGDKTTAIDDNTVRQCAYAARSRVCQMMFKCAECIYMTIDEDRMAAHVKAVHKTLPRIFMCTICNVYETSWNHEYYAHMMNKHFRVSVNRGACTVHELLQGPPYTCDLCDEACTKLQQLLAHRMRHSMFRGLHSAVMMYRQRSRLQVSINHGREYGLHVHVSTQVVAGGASALAHWRTTIHVYTLC
jgi:hypothetical protein